VEPVSNFTSAEDGLVLEDDSGRVVLAGGERVPIRAMCTGMVMAAVGMAREGSFVVEDFCQAGLAPQKPCDAQVSCWETHPYTDE
jgi:hypothetical protein